MKKRAGAVFFKKAITLMLFLIFVVGFYYIRNNHTVPKHYAETSSQVILFDDTKNETAGNADWVINGAYSAWANSLEQLGFVVKSLAGYTITKSALNGVAVFVIPEPQDVFSASETMAIKDFVDNGGGLVIISDHAGADRNRNGWDAVHIFNNSLNTADFGIIFALDKISQHPITNLNKKDFPEALQGVNSIGVWGGATLNLSGKAKPLALSDNGPVAAVSFYGNGRIVAIGDSSIFDDGTGDFHDKLYDNWDDYDDSVFGINIIKWCFEGQTVSLLN